MKKVLLMLVFILPIILGFSVRGHYWSTDKAFQYSPEVMDAFRNRFQGPVLNSFPPYYMYPDVYEQGHALEKLADNAAQHYQNLVKAMEEENWSNVEKEIGYVAHYCGDAASPTQNSSATWGEIDDAYDVLVDSYIEDVTLDDNFSDPITVENVRQYYLDRCYQSATLVDSLIIFYKESNSKEEMWSKSKHIFEQQLNYAVRDLRNILFTAWDAAGRPDSFVGSSGCSSMMPFMDSDF